MLSSRETRTGLWRGMAFGLASWAFGMPVLVPALRGARPAWSAGPVENTTNRRSPGFRVDQLVVEEPSRQTRGRTSDAERMSKRVG
jgi:hypothetical protein